jgi:NAD(P)-dependent dehydrogenase (short-subunit alcohol dehydrogenase family)
MPLGHRATQGRPGRRVAPQVFGRQATGREIAYAALFLISDGSVYVTRQTLAVDSGLTGIS